MEKEKGDPWMILVLSVMITLNYLEENCHSDFFIHGAEVHGYALLV